MRLKFLTAMFVLGSILALGGTPTARADNFTIVDASGFWGGAPGQTFPPGGISFNTSFEWDATTKAIVPDSVVTSSTGAGPFTSYILDWGSGYFDVDFGDANGDGVQLYLTDAYRAGVYPRGDTPFDIPGDIGSADELFLTCFPPACVPGVGGIGIFAGEGSIVVYDATPEPSELVLTLLGLGLLGVVVVVRKRASLRHQLAGGTHRSGGLMQLEKNSNV